jgi:hypothetical protein
VSQLYDLKILIEKTIEAKGLDAVDTKGKIALKSGRLLAFISPSSPDDPVYADKLKQAIKDVLNVNA